MRTDTDRKTDSRLRALAKRHGYHLEKSRGAEHANNLGGYRVVHTATNVVEAGSNFDMMDADVEAFFADASDDAKPAVPDELEKLLASLRIIGRDGHASYGVAPEPLVVAWVVRAWLAEAAGKAVPIKTPDVAAAFGRGHKPPKVATKDGGVVNAAFGHWLSGCGGLAKSLLAGARRHETIEALQALAVEFPLADAKEPAQNKAPKLDDYDETERWLKPGAAVELEVARAEDGTWIGRAATPLNGMMAMTFYRKLGFRTRAEAMKHLKAQDFAARCKRPATSTQSTDSQMTNL